MGGWGIKKMQKIVALHPLSFHVLSHSTSWTHGREEERGDPPWPHNPWLNQEPGFRVAPWSNWLDKQTGQASGWELKVGGRQGFADFLVFFRFFPLSSLFFLPCLCWDVGKPAVWPRIGSDGNWSVFCVQFWGVFRWWKAEYAASSATTTHPP